MSENRRFTSLFQKVSIAKEVFKRKICFSFLKNLCKTSHSFFKWLKPHLKIKKYWGTTENAARIQIAVTIITYCPVAIVHHDMK